MVDKEKLVANIIREAEENGETITRAEAEEMAEMEIKANEIVMKTFAKCGLFVVRAEPCETEGIVSMDIAIHK